MVLNGGAMIGMSFTALVDINNAFSATEKIFEVLDRKPKIDCNPMAGLKLDQISGNTDIQDGVFAYPTRKNINILKKLNLSIQKGEKIALVGQSGCGKSTVIQMIQRFYDLDEGSLSLDNNDIRNLNLPFVRSNLGIVSQEPVLFNKTIAENIKYGDNDRDIPMNEVIESARKANIHNFVTGLPQGYETNVGGKGTQLSGGQKQRVAIARALIRNPQILLLDEATSALDTESEKVVQAALDNAREGRTTIVVAHRLSTIRTADVIVAIDEGRVKEMGTHNELMSNKDLYYNLVMRQMANKNEEKQEKIYPELDDEDEDNKEKSENDDSKVGRLVRSASRASRKLSRQMSVIKTGREVNEKKADKEALEEDLPKIQMWRIMKRNSPEFVYIFIGVLASSAMGAVMPLFGIIFGDILGVMAYEDTNQARKESVTFALYFVALGFFALITQSIQVIIEHLNIS